MCIQEALGDNPMFMLHLKHQTSLSLPLQWSDISKIFESVLAASVSGASVSGGRSPDFTLVLC